MTVDNAVHRPVDERRRAVGEFHNIPVLPGELRQVDRDRTELARALTRLGMDRHEIADVISVHWLLLDRVLAGGRA
jgi:hypothetical protein